MRRSGTKAQDVAIGHVIGDGKHALLQCAAVFESVVLAAGEVCDGLGRVLAHTVHGHQGCDLCEPQRWRELAQAVIGFFRFALLL